MTAIFVGPRPDGEGAEEDGDGDGAIPAKGGLERAGVNGSIIKHKIMATT